ncbi:MAG TPA: CofH family radical SAM protein [Candidatus Omnitrophota bacterium]|nr:CofH family radical SAM protein [Candidatus Omnitrophota bacterium]
MPGAAVDSPFFSDRELGGVFEKVRSGTRLEFEDGVKLFRSRDFSGVGWLANFVRERLHGKNAHFSNYLNLNPTNICVNRCLFCHFFRDSGAPDAYVLSRDAVLETVANAVALHGVREIHIVSGLNDAVSPDYYFEIVSWVREAAPSVFIKAYTAVEIDYLSRRTGLGAGEVLRQLQTRGIGSIPGGGAEIFSEDVRGKICPRKINAGRWLEIHKIAHRLGIPSNATMLYGHIERVEDRVDHLLRLRALQDETSGFNAFIPLPYQTGKEPREDLLKDSVPDGITDLKVCSAARLLLDNIPHIRVHWPAIGLRFAQAALSFGADDLGGTAVCEKILKGNQSGEPEPAARDEMIRLIRESGFTPLEVTSNYASFCPA